jgi:hypothetical protein
MKAMVMMTRAEPSTPRTEVILLLRVVVLPNLLGRLEEVLRDLVMTVILLDLVVLVEEEVVAGVIPDVLLATMTTVHGLLSSRH